MTLPEHDDVRGLIGAAAVGAVSSEELRRVERHVALCAVCAEDLEMLRGTSALLALAVPQHRPPPSLRTALMREAARDVGARTPPPRRRWLPSWAWPSLAAGLAAAALALGIWNVNLRGDSSTWRRVEVTGTAAPDSRLAVTKLDGRPVAVLRLRLKDQPQGRGWEVWAIRDGAAQSAGFLERQSDGTYVATVDVSGASLLAVTPEPLQNRLVPTGPKVAIAAVDL
ncbi:MAG: anti-sigma factor [Actinobacteria bacterium]|nr:anti-sigma factor [Actinomycetota bacterium]